MNHIDNFYKFELNELFNIIEKGDKYANELFNIVKKENFPIQKTRWGLSFDRALSVNVDGVDYEINKKDSDFFLITKNSKVNISFYIFNKFKKLHDKQQLENLPKLDKFNRDTKKYNL